MRVLLLKLGSDFVYRILATMGHFKALYTDNKVFLMDGHILNSFNGECCR